MKKKAKRKPKKNISENTLSTNPLFMILLIVMFVIILPLPIISHFKTIEENKAYIEKLTSLEKSDITIVSSTQVRMKNVMEIEEIKKHVPLVLLRTKKIDKEVEKAINFIEESYKFSNTPNSIKFLNAIPKEILTNILKNVFSKIAIIEKDKITNFFNTNVILIYDTKEIKVEKIILYPFNSISEIEKSITEILGKGILPIILKGIAYVIYNIGEPNTEFNLDYQEKKITKYIKESKVRGEIEIPKGEIIIAKGEKIDENKAKFLREYFEELNKKDLIKTLLIEIIFLAIAFLTTLVVSSFKDLRNTQIMVINTGIMLSSLYIQFFLKESFKDEIVFLSFFLLFTVLNSLISGRKVTFLISIYYFIAFFMLISQSYLLIIYYTTLGIVTIIMSSRINRRSEFIFIALIIFLTTTVLYVIIHYINTMNLEITREAIFLSFFSSFLNVLLVLLILPIYEYFFLIATPFKLYELSSPENELLRELLKKATGTYYHSLNVSILAEAAAEAIGANPLLAKVGALYHDIGKIEHPDFYTENIGGKTREDINVFRYVEVIKSHPKVGAEIAKRHRLPREIQKIILEHHGQSLITYFYNKALKENPNINIEFFRYDTPKPSTKESALIFICDKLEAKIRSIESNTSLEAEKILEEVDNTISQLVLSEDLSNSNLTLRDINNLKKTLKENFIYILHKRITYPQTNYKAA